MYKHVRSFGFLVHFGAASSSLAATQIEEHSGQDGSFEITCSPLHPFSYQHHASYHLPGLLRYIAWRILQGKQVEQAEGGDIFGGRDTILLKTERHMGHSPRILRECRSLDLELRIPCRIIAKIISFRLLASIYTE